MTWARTPRISGCRAVPSLALGQSRCDPEPGHCRSGVQHGGPDPGLWTAARPPLPPQAGGSLLSSPPRHPDHQTAAHLLCQEGKGVPWDPGGRWHLGRLCRHQAGPRGWGTQSPGALDPSPPPPAPGNGQLPSPPSLPFPDWAASCRGPWSLPSARGGQLGRGQAAGPMGGSPLLRPRAGVSSVESQLLPPARSPGFCSGTMSAGPPGDGIHKVLGTGPGPAETASHRRRPSLSGLPYMRDGGQTSPHVPQSPLRKPAWRFMGWGDSPGTVCPLGREGPSQKHRPSPSPW